MGLAPYESAFERASGRKNCEGSTDAESVVECSQRHFHRQRMCCDKVVHCS